MIPFADTKVIYVGDGKTTVFPFTFKYADVSDIKIAIYNPETDISVELQKDYFIDGTLGAVIYPGYPPGEEIPEAERPPVLDSGRKIVIRRQTEISQPVDLGEKYPLRTLETMHDRAVLLLQELNEIMDRAVKVTAGSDKTPDDVISDIKDNAERAAGSAYAAAESESKAADYADAAGARIDEIAGYAREAEASKNQTIGYAAMVIGRAAEMWRSDKAYQANTPVVYSDGYIYQSKEYSAPGTIPPESNLWVRIKVALDDFMIMDDNGYMTLSEAPTFSNIFILNKDGYVTLKKEA